MSSQPRSRRWFGAVAGVALAALLGLTLTAGAASGAGPKPPTDDDRSPRELQVVGGASAQAALQAITPTPELLFVPVTPCRVVDTRGAVGPITSGQTRTYYIGGTFGFAPQGGTSGGCGIPGGAKAVSATFTAVNPTKSGYLRAWAAGQAEPGATLLNYATNSIGIGSVVPLQDAQGKLSVKNYQGPTHLVIDVNGYYIQQLQAYISSSGTVLDQSGRLVSATRTGTGTYTLVWDRDISSCSGQASSDISGYIESVYTSGTSAYIYVYNNAGTASDYWANVVINC